MKLNKKLNHIDKISQLQKQIHQGETILDKNNEIVLRNESILQSCKEINEIILLFNTFIKEIEKNIEVMNINIQKVMKLEQKKMKNDGQF